MKLEASNEELLLPIFLFIIVIIIASILTAKQWKGSLLKVLIILLSTFLIVYIPVVEYWSNWTDSKIFWPNDFIANSSVIIDGETVAANTLFDKGYALLSLISQFLIYYTVLTFIYFITNNQQSELTIKKWISWVPVINIFSIALILNRLLNKSWSSKATLITWVASTSIWVYYTFFALILTYWDVDSFSIIDHFLFGNFYQEFMADADPEYIKMTSTPIGYQMSYLSDLVNIITPIFTFISGGSLLFILQKIKKNNNVPT